MISLEELKKIVKTKDLLKSKPRPIYTEKIASWLKRKEIVIIKGIRRSGKTHIMYQLMQKIDNAIYINFDDFRLDPYLNTELLELLVKLRKEKKRTYFFLDEIQRVNGFEKWLRTYYDKEENIKFVIGGSSISLMSPKLSTVLTGRNITFIIYPLTFQELKTFSKISFEQYLEYGGFPEIVLEKELTKKRELLEQYVNDIIMKDILDKYTITNTTQIKALVMFFLSNPGVRISANKLSKQLGIHKDTAQKYIDYIIDTFLIFEVPYFSYSAKTKYIGNQASKYYCIDNGIQTITAIKKNTSTLFENLVAINLKQESKELFYWFDCEKIDFVSEKKAIQVIATDKIPKRKITAFEEFNKKHKNIRDNIIITPTKNTKIDNVDVKSITSFLE
jgi:uncharacterized protein